MNDANINGICDNVIDGGVRKFFPYGLKIPFSVR